MRCADLAGVEHLWATLLSPHGQALEPWEDMTSGSRNIAVFGSTGSIGRNTLEVIAGSQGRLRAWALSAHSNLHLLGQQAREHVPSWVLVTGDARPSADWIQTLPPGVKLDYDEEGMRRIAAMPEVDVVVAGIVGAAGLAGTWTALEAGKTVAFANKETLVMAGPLVMDLAASKGGRLLPVDSEHSAIFQALQAGRRNEVKRIVLTASGGPFAKYTRAQLSEVTVDDALAHPTWNMGRKITVDSATMMNKALEIIEARWLFDMRVDQIEVVIHPQSIVHSMVEFVDGSVVAQLSPPDMRLPIALALSWPDRYPSPAQCFDWHARHELTFESPDREKFPALDLGYEVARAGGTSGAVLNAANEAAVAGFLAGNLAFLKIVAACKAVLDHHTFDPHPTLEQLLQLDAWARTETIRWMHSC